MDRSTFLAGLTAALPLAGSMVPFAALAEGQVTTQRDLFASLPQPKSHDWTRIILGSGAKYQKQIGAGIETAQSGEKLYYYELQIGSPGGSCNPSTMRKAYLREPSFGALLDTYPLIANIGRTGNLVFRYGDVTGEATANNPADTRLRLLDEAYLYDPRPVRIVSLARAQIHVASQNLDAMHIVGEYPKAGSASERLRHIELWHDPRFPFGLARYRATVAGLDPFEMHVYSHGADFSSILDLSLAEVRDITRNGAYGQLASGPTD
jgi:hypothetical protein